MKLFNRGNEPKKPSRKELELEKQRIEQEKLAEKKKKEKRKNILLICLAVFVGLAFLSGIVEGDSEEESTSQSIVESITAQTTEPLQTTAKTVPIETTVKETTTVAPTTETTVKETTVLTQPTTIISVTTAETTIQTVATTASIAPETTVVTVQTTEVTIPETTAITGTTTETALETTPSTTESTTAISTETTTSPIRPKPTQKFDIKKIPPFHGKPYVAVNNNIPFFTEDDYTTISFEKYSKLDGLGRCGAAFVNVGKDIMPTAPRGEIGRITPSGWHSVRYENVDGKYLYNRCHLIGYQLSAENANERNLITGTRYLNMEGMLPFENMIADYVKETDAHVLYRVTPIFEYGNLLATGVLMEAYSVEDNGAGVCFNVFCYNAQPDIHINYENGDSYYDGPNEPDVTTQPEETYETMPSNPTYKSHYILNTKTKKFHYPTCWDVNKMHSENKADFYGDREQLISQGYSPCGHCDP